MSIHFRQALAYPFQPENRQACLWIPGAFFCVLFLFGLTMGLVITLLGGNPSVLNDPGNWSNPMVFTVSLFFQFAQMALQLFGGALTLGFLWRLAARFQRDGLSAPSIRWFEDLPGLLLDGLKAFLYYVVVSILLTVPALLLIGGLVILTVVMVGVGAKGDYTAASVLAIFALILVSLVIWLGGMVLLGPFLLAPLLRAAQSRSMGELFHLDRAWRSVLPRYGQAVRGMLYLVLLSATYGVGFIVLVVCTLGLGMLAVPFLCFAPYVSMTHLAVQALPYPEKPEGFSDTPAITPPEISGSADV